MAESITAKLLTFFLESSGRNQLQPGEWELIGTRILGDEDFEDVPPWVRKQIDRICAKGLGTTPDELTHFLRGKTFLYRLDFDGQDGDILGVYRTLRSGLSMSDAKESPWGQELAAAAAPKAKLHENPHTWVLVGTSSYGKSDFGKIPTWVRKKISYIYQHGPGSSLGGLTYYLKGNRYRYKLEFAGQGGPIVNVFRKPRTWWWKKQLK